MTEERDSDLHTLFAEAAEELSAETFISAVTARIERQKSRKLALRMGACLGALMIAFILAAPMQDAVNALVLALTYPLVTLDNPLLAQLLLPVNNIAALVALCSLTLSPLYRRLF